MSAMGVNHAINRMIFPAIASFYHMIFSFPCQFSQRPDFQVIFYGDDPSPPPIHWIPAIKKLYFAVKASSFLIFR